MTMNPATTTRFADEFKDSPRYPAILAVFKAIDELKDGEPIYGVLAKMNRTTHGGNAEERARLPDLVSKALKETGRSERL